MPEPVVSDTGPMLHLSEINSLALLGQFEKLIISDLVSAELKKLGALEAIMETLCDKLETHRVKSSEINEQSREISGFVLHRTDLSVVALVLRFAPMIVLTDDLELRKALESRNILVVGSIGVLFRSFSSGQLHKNELRVILDRLFDGSTLYLSKGLKNHVIARLDALPNDPNLQENQ